MQATPAQTPPAVIRPALPRVACAGETVSRIELHRYAPSSQSAAQRAAEATDEDAAPEIDPRRRAVILAYLRLKPGAPCLERDRRESERMLRGQPFLSSAQVTARPDGAGRVRIRVDVVDEFPWLLGGAVAADGIRAVRVGTLDLRGRGLRTELSAERGGAYRNGGGMGLAKYGFLGRPAVATLQAEHLPLGTILLASVSQPFLTDLQRDAYDASLSQETAYQSLLRGPLERAAVRTQRSTYHAGWVHRVGAYRRDRPLGLAGLMFVGSDVRTTNSVVVISDTGLVGTGDSVLNGRYPDHGVSRIAVLGGLRALRFITVRGFDALRASQDVGTGVQLNLMIAPAVWRASNTRDVLVAGDLYAGVGHDKSFASLSMRAEAQPATGARSEYAGVVASARLSWHLMATERRTHIVSLSLASLHDLGFPAQLTLRDPDGGLIGHPGSRDAGGQRVVARAEERLLLPWFSRRADTGLAVFVDGGRLWAGDAPYGADSPVRSSAGISLLAAFPSGGKRTYRLDLGVPLSRVSGETGLALRFSVTDRTVVGWAEPRDVSQARTGSGRMSLMRW